MAAKMIGTNCELFHGRVVREHQHVETESKVYELQQVMVWDKIADNVTFSFVRAKPVDQEGEQQ